MEYPFSRALLAYCLLASTAPSMMDTSRIGGSQNSGEAARV
jgi:hypothetical protein